jgi:Flp pilus assembly pilin Flp
MISVMSTFKSFLADESGAVSIEYGFAVLFAGAIAVAILGTVRNQVQNAFNSLNNRIQNQMNNAAQITG